MKKFFYRSGLVVLLMMISGGVSYALNPAQLNRDTGTVVSEGRSAVDSAGESVLKAVQSVPRGIRKGSSAVGDFFSEPGKGFYMNIYKNTVSQPTEMMREELKKRFGLNFSLSLKPKPLSGQKTFIDLYDSPVDAFSMQYVPQLQNTLSESCARIRAGSIDEEARRLELARKRLSDKKLLAESGGDVGENADTKSQDEIDVEAVNRLIRSFPAARKGFIEQLVKKIPTRAELEDQQVLLNCELEIRDAVDFEMRLQQLLQPQRKQLEVLQTFMNGKLENFEGLPRYDLVLDIDVIESIFFGTGVSSGVVGGTGNTKKSRSAKEALQVFRELTDNSNADLPDNSGRTGVGSLSFVRAVLDPFKSSFVSKISSQPSSLGFSKRSSASSGPLCPDKQGLGLDFSKMGKKSVKAGSANTQETVAGLESSPLAELIRTDKVGTDMVLNKRIAERKKASPPQKNGKLLEGKQSALNVQSVCQGSSAFDFGNDLIRMVFCLTVEFSKVGKTWTKVRDDCISCSIAKMNQVFEEMLLNKSVRPHKNTGTIMESALCEDAYGNDVGFFSFVEWVPVKFYPDICYPEGGVSNEDTARLTGYPELVSKVDKKGMSVDCEVDFQDEKAQDRCKEALIFSSSLDYDQYQIAYLIKDDLWKRLVGERGEAERELHDFLYRLGKVEARFGEEKVLKQDLLQRKSCLNERIALVQTDNELVLSAGVDEKTRELLKIKGYFEGESLSRLVPEACDAEDTVSLLEADIAGERERVMKGVARFNQASRDFNRTASCSPFADPGLFDQLSGFVRDRVANGSYYVDTKFRATQTPQEKVSGQILDNTDVSDIGDLLNAIGNAVDNNQVSLRQQQDQKAFESQQKKSQMLPMVLGKELTNFRTILQGFTNWWSEMVDKKSFVDKSGKRVNALDSFLGKRRR